jgi:hypothetical protein
MGFDPPPSSPPPPPRRGWRPGTSKDRSNEAQHKWRQRAAQPVKEKRPWSKRSKFLFRAGLLGAVIGLIVVVILWLWPPKRIALVLVGAGYEENLALPHNVYGMNGLEGIQKAVQERERDYHVDYLGPDKITSWQDTLRAQKNERCVVLYLALHGGADSRGPYLFKGLHPGADSEEVLLVKEVLAQLKELPNHKILILDATQSSGPLPLMLHNDFSRELLKLDEEIQKIPNLIVINSTDVDQVSWSSEEWRCTAFGHYLIEGFRGAIPEARVNAEQLFDYVRKKVQHWAWDNRDAIQTPILLPKDSGHQRARQIEIIPGRPEYKAPTPDPRPLDEKRLTAHWGSWQELEKAAPSPGAYSPQLWRQYRDTLLRYEQLMRASASEGVLKKIEGTLATLHDAIVKARSPGLMRSAYYALPMRTVLGQPSEPTALEKQLFSRLWSAEKKWEEVAREAKFNEEARKLFQAKLGDWLLDKVSKDATTLSKAAAVMQAVDRGREARTAEMHYLVMLNEGRKYLFGEKKKWASTEDLEFALKTRRLAEQVALATWGITDRDKSSHPYSELVFPWIRKRVEEADESRRVGEDLLFSADEAERNTGKQKLGKASKLYELAGKDAARVRRALETRDRLLADLPYYAAWLAQSKEPESEKFLKETEELWQETHRLTQELAGPVPDNQEELRKKIDRVAESVKLEKLEKAFTHVQEFFRQQWDRPAAKRIQQNWHSLDGLLNVPQIPVAKRWQLLDTLRTISGKLNQDQASKTDAPEAVTQGQKEDLEKQAQLHAQRRGRMALAILGAPWCAACRKKESSLPDFEEASKELERLGRAEVANWWRVLQEANVPMSKRWQLLTQEIEESTAKGRVQPLEEAAKLLPWADQLVRQLDGAGASRLKQNPADAHRRLRLHNLLLWQADRTRRDQWWGEEEDRVYFQSAGSAYVLDARELVSDGLRDDQKRPRWVLALKREEELKHEPSLKFYSQSFGPEVSRLPGQRLRLDITSEEKIALQYDLGADEWVSPGYPVMAYHVEGPADKPLVARDANEGFNKPRAVAIQPSKKQAIPAWSSKNPFYPEFLKADAETPRDTEPAKARCELRGFYRGRKLPLTTDIHLHPRANVVVYQHPLPDRSGVAVVAGDSARKKFSPEKGAISILVDYSGSMKGSADLANNAQKVPIGERRIDAALEALKGLLENIPEKSQVSLHIFAAIPKGKEPEAVRARQQVAPGKELGTWESWDPALHKTDFFNKLEPWEPYGFTPLVTSVVEASRPLKNFDGPRTLIVLTDGGDNKFKERTGQEPSNIPAYLKNRFLNSEIRIFMVGFIDDPTKQLDADEQVGLKYTREALEKLDPPGEFVFARNATQLKELLRTGLWKYQFEWRGAKAKKKAAEKVPNQIIFRLKRSAWNELTWTRRLPGPYEVWLTTTSNAKRQKQQEEFAQTIKLNRGDLLLLRSDGKRLERALYVDPDAGAEEIFDRDKVSGWMLALLQSEQRKFHPAFRHELTVGVDNYLNTKEDEDKHLQQIKPGGVWLELHSPGKLGGLLAPGLRWGGDLGFPMPTWRLETTERMKDPFQVKAWVSSNEPVKALEVTTVKPLRNRLEEVKGVGEVLIVDVTTEWFKVPSEDGKPRKQPCVVVRLRFPKDKLVFATPAPNVNINKGGGWEHHFYTDPKAEYGCYTGVFWYGDLEERSVSKLSLHSVEAFKNDSETRLLTVPISDPSQAVGDQNAAWRKILEPPEG